MLQVEVGKVATVSVLHVQEEALLALDGQTTVNIQGAGEQRVLQESGFLLTLRGYFLKDWFPSRHSRSRRHSCRVTTCVFSALVPQPLPLSLQ